MELGLKCLQKGSGDCAVVFIHGILSDGEKCWRHKNGTYWPDLLANADSAGSLRIFVYTFQSDIFSADYNLHDVVDDLRQRLRSAAVEDLPRIVFVCHSMGGIIARRYLVRRQLDGVGSGRGTTFGLFLVASPSLGAEWADWLKPIAESFRHSQADALRFSKNNTWLDTLNRDFRDLKESRKLDLHGRELIEDKFIVLRKLFFLPKIVERISGTPYFGEPLKIAGSDHSSVAKPQDGKALQHQALCEFISKVATNFGATAQGAEHTTLESSQRRAENLEEIIDPKGWLAGKRLEILPRASDMTDPHGLPVGVFASRIAAVASKDRHPPYIRRDIDPDIDETLRRGKFLLVVGAPRAGKTRTSWEGVLRNLRDHRVIFPNRACAAPLATLTSMDPLPTEGGKVILWLDDAYRLLASGDLSYQTLTRLRELYPHLVTIATVAIHEVDGLRKPKGSAGGDPSAMAALDFFSRVLSEFVELRLNDHLRKDSEAEARRLYPGLVDQPGFVQGVGRFFAASEERWASYVGAFDSNKVAAGVVTAAIDWSRTGMLRPVTGNEISRLAVAYVARLETTPVLTGKIEEALAWASSASLLVKISDDGAETGEFRVPADMVRRAGEKGTPWGESIPSETWDFVLATLRPDDGIGVALAAIEADNWEIALRAAEFAAESRTKGGAAAALLAGVSRLMIHGPSDQVYNHLERAAAEEDDNLAAAASFMLAPLRLETGHLDEAERLVSRYLDATDIQRKAAARILTAMGALHREQYDRAKAYAESVLETELSEHNVVSAALLLIQMAERAKVSDLSKIESLMAPFLRSPKNTTYHVANFVTGLIALKRGQIERARDAWKTAKAGAPPFLAGRVSVMLGTLAVIVGEFQEAESLLQPLLASTDTFVAAYASFGTGILLVVKGNLDAARTHFQRAIDRSQFAIRKQAQLQLAVLEATQGNTDAARSLLAPYQGSEDAAASVAQAAALAGDLKLASAYLPPEQFAKLPLIDQLLMVQRGLLAADDPNRLDAAEWLLAPFIGSENLILASLSGLGSGIVATARRQFNRAEELLGPLVEKAPSRLSMMAKLQLGAASLQKGDLLDAERRLAPLVEDAAVAVRANLLLGMVWLARGQSERAQFYFKRASEIAIDAPELGAAARLQLAAISLGENQIDEAARLFELGAAGGTVALKSASEMGLSQVAERRGDIDAARKHAQAAIAQKPDNALALARVVVLASTQGDRRASLEAQSRLGTMARLFVHQILAEIPPGAEQRANVPKDFGQFLDLARQDPDAAVRVVQSEGRMAAAQLLMMDDHKEEALAEIDGAISLDSRNRQALFTRGEWRRLDNRPDHALDDFNSALQLDPEWPAALASRGQTHRVLGKFREAVADLDRAIEIEPDLEWALVERAGLALERGDQAQATADVRRLAEINGEIVNDLIARANNTARNGEQSKALEILTLVLLLEPKNKNALVGRGSIFGSLGKDHEALSDFKTALELAPDDVVALIARGEHYANRWQPEAALADIDRATALDPKNAVVVANRGVILGLLGRHDEAITHLSEALRLDPQQAWVLAVRGAQYRRTSRLGESAADLDRAIEIQGENNSILSQRAETAIAAGDYALAVDLLTRAIGRPPVNSSWAYYTRGRAQYAKGLDSAATEDFQEAIRIAGIAGPVSPMDAFNHALFRLAGGQTTEALGRYRGLIHEAPAELLQEVLVDLEALKTSGPWDAVAGAEVVGLMKQKSKFTHHSYPS